MRARRHRSGLLAGAAAVGLLALPAGAAAQQGAGQGLGQQNGGSRTGPLSGSSWTIDLRATYSDNFRRLPDALDRTLIFPADVQIGEVDGEPVFAELPVSAQEGVAIDPPDNVIASAVLSGGSVFARSGLSAIVSGSIRVNGYLDQAGFDERLEGALQRPVGPGILPDGVTEDDVLARTFGLNDNNDEIWIRPNLSGSASMRLVEDLLFVDVSALAQQQTISRRNDIQIEVDGRLGDQATFVGGSISPYLFREFSNGGSAELRYRHSEIIVADENFRGDVFAGGLDFEGDQFSNDSVADEIRASWRSGTFGRLTVGLNATAVTTDDSGSDVLPETQFDRLSGQGELGYDVTPTLRLTAEGGYDEVTVDNAVLGGDAEIDARVESEFSGVFWSAGFDWRPSRQTSLALSFGERYGGTQVRGTFRYEPTPRLSVSARADRSLGAGAQEAFRGFGRQNQLTFGILNRLGAAQTGSADRLLGDALRFQSGFNGFVQPQAGLAARDRLGVNLAYNMERTNLAADLSYNTTEFFAAREDGFGERSNEIYAATLSASRRVGRRTTAFTSVRYLRSDGLFLDDEARAPGDSPTGTQETYLGSAGLSYSVGRHLAFNGRVFYSARDGAEDRFRVNFEEKGVSGGISWTF